MKRRSGLMLVTMALVAAGCGTGPPDDESEAGLENGSFTAELNGFNIHYEVHGKGPVLMTVPNSWGLTLDGLRALYRPLEDHLRAVGVELRKGTGIQSIIPSDEGLSIDGESYDYVVLATDVAILLY